jgi:hypothetical protein
MYKNTIKYFLNNLHKKCIVLLCLIAFCVSYIQHTYYHCSNIANLHILNQALCSIQKNQSAINVKPNKNSNTIIFLASLQNALEQKNKQLFNTQQLKDISQCLWCSAQITFAETNLLNNATPFILFTNLIHILPLANGFSTIFNDKDKFWITYKGQAPPFFSLII